MRPENGIIHGDCIDGMTRLPEGCVDLVFADPPFNIGYDYDVYDDRQEHAAYLDWSRKWIAAVHRALKADGTFWLAIGDEYAAELKLLSQEHGFTCRSWVVWYYTFGVNCKKKFTRSHAHLFHFVKNAKQFTFNAEAVRVPSARQLVYNDARANPVGRLPDDTWILRPQDLPEGFQADEDTWYFPRVAGTFKERAGFHGCQMPEQLLGRIIRCCSNPGELVLDPFSGSATTVTVAKKLGRGFLAFDLSEDYVQLGLQRLEGTREGDALVGAAEPLVSAPATPGFVTAQRSPVPAPAPKPASPKHSPLRITAEEREAVVAAFERVHGGYSTDYLLANADLNARFVEACRKNGAALPAVDLNRALLRLRKSSQLPAITSKRVEISRQRFDEFAFASEIATRQLQFEGHSLDDILCDPALSEKFDLYAAQIAPGFDSFEYRWGAFRLRKEFHNFIRQRDALDPRRKRRRGERPIGADKLGRLDLPVGPGIYRVFQPQSHDAYIGITTNLRRRLQHLFNRDQFSEVWGSSLGELCVAMFPESGVAIGESEGFRQFLVEKHDPLLNYRLLTA